MGHFRGPIKTIIYHRKTKSIECDLPTMEKIHTAVKTLRNNKTPGIDNIPVELCKNREQAITVTLHRVIGKIWKEETIPKNGKNQ